MKTNELNRMGLRSRAHLRAAYEAISRADQAGFSEDETRDQLAEILRDPEAFAGDPIFGALAQAVLEEPPAEPAPVRSEARSGPARWTQFGTDLDPKSVEQMQTACRLPVAVRGALMPDAHLGYGLPIGGVLAVDNAVIPYAVGVDIACRMKLTVLDLPAEATETQQPRLARALQRETSFGVGAKFATCRRHDVMDADWNVSPVTARLKDKAWEQLGTSGSGNHFVEFGLLTVTDPAVGIEPGRYLALLSHSGSRGTGAEVARHYSDLAARQHNRLPKNLQHLAWLDLESQPGQEYWQAMQLMGRYASANHELIHRQVLASLGAQALLDIENHHNFAWIEQHDGREVIVHRKGATPAGAGALGIIPGSMATPGFVVRGRGNEASLASASHGAGRVMSRRQAKKQCDWKTARRFLAERNVELLSGGLDEVPMAYKDIHEVMAAQRQLVDVLARFDPRLVKMAPGK